MKKIALIPARSGSKRVPHKNISLLEGHPLLAYSITSALNSQIFDAVICATDSDLYGEIATYYGAEVPFLRPDTISGDKSPDIEWVTWILGELARDGRSFDVFSILRPTNPFRSSATIVSAWEAFSRIPYADSLRAIELCKQHPGKMWMKVNDLMVPLLPFSNGTTPWHSSQYAALPEVYVQNASLEIAWTKTVFQKGSISGEAVIPFINSGIESFDINMEEDWKLAEIYIESGKASLPHIAKAPYKFK